jgi:type I restriction enzyme S subunit
MPKTLSSRVLLNQRVGRFRVLSHENLDYGYLKYFLNSPRFQGKVKDTAAGAAQPNISGKQIEAIPIPLPPLPIPKKIAAVLEKADELRKKRQEQIKRLDDLLQATFLDMFGDPVTNPKGWETAKICDFAEVKIGPFGSLLHVEDYIEDGVPLINPSHIVDGEINPDPKLSLTAKKFEELSAYALLKNDVVIGRRGEIGRCAVVRKEPFFCGTGSMLIRTKNSLLPDILQNILSSSQVREKLTNEAVGVTMKNLNAGIIKNLVVPLPPTNLQKHFLDFSKKVNLRKVEMQFAKNKISEGFNSLMQDAFKGELDLT